ncbi:LIM and calponin homology domains-containing protein 1 isoform X2 [Spea bombifrons]|uniref:LIM and calponin homology domains-containing protein 1 isoform X2 n=1 Tax=Spea bombifrons TaxID=233779 RepID=UPI00234BF650|nr:LIM and calponin homology domains-containing protein 1 isoform X2 [Spea bombifrons]
MASPALGLQEIQQPQESPPDSACREAQKWIEQVTGRSFGDKDFRSGLENGILLCELLNAIKPGLVKKINRLPTPIAGLDNITLFLRGCKELGLKESQLFDPGDLQDIANRTTLRISDCNRKLRNVLVTVYWLGKAAHSCASYSGNHLDLKEFEGLLAQMRKENEDLESPKRSIRDSGYIDCWDSERSDSLSPPRHGRDDSFDSLDSFGSRSQQTPSPDVVLRGSSDGRGSDSESDLPHRRFPDVRKDDMSARRVSIGESRACVPFNQYLPNKSNQTAYIPAPLRKKKAEREDYRKSWSTATSPSGGERPFSQNHPETIEEEQNDTQSKDDGTKLASSPKRPSGKTETLQVHLGQQGDEDAMEKTAIPKALGEAEKLKSLEQAGIKVLPATRRYGSEKQAADDGEPDIVLRKDNAFLMGNDRADDESEEEEEDCRVPDLERDDLATRRAKMNQPKTSTPFNQYIHGSYLNKTKARQEPSKSPTPPPPVKHVINSPRENREEPKAAKPVITQKENCVPNPANGESDSEDERGKVPDIQRDDLAKRKAQGAVSQQKEPLVFAVPTITKADMETWQRLKVSSEDSDHLVAKQPRENDQIPKIDATRATNDDFGRRKLSLQEKRARNKQKFVHFGSVTEIDQQRWDRLCIAKAGADQESGADVKDGPVPEIVNVKKDSLTSAQSSSILENMIARASIKTVPSQMVVSSELCVKAQSSEPPERGGEGQILDTQRDDMLSRRTGAFQKLTRPRQMSSVSNDEHLHDRDREEKCLKGERNEEKQTVSQDESQQVDSKHKPSLENNLQINPNLPALAKDESQEVCTLEKDTNAPDLGKDDMLVRRLSVTQRQTGVGISHFLPVPFSVQKREDKTLICAKKEEKPTSSIPTDTLMPKDTTEASTKADRFDHPSEPHHTDGHFELNDEPTHHPACDPAQSRSVVNPLNADLNSQLQGTVEKYDQEVLRFSPRPALSDDAESMSMCDMRYEDEARMLPHSRAHQEHLQNINDLLKEEDDTWQDDLAKWKTRRRSASQDLIKKEQERKKMERLLSGEYDLTERRRSIKTYKEIVEEKERRERELHEAYKNAKSKEEAEKILQKYIEKFTISEAVLERLVMPKILERSHSVEPSLLTSPEDPNLMKYLRQQSLPSPKYTATVEATISPSNDLDSKFRPGRSSPVKSVISKAVPMLTPKPYSQLKNSQQVLKTFKVDGKINLNGETFNGVEDKGRSFAPTLTRSQLFEGKARVDTGTETKKDVSCVELNLTRPNMQKSNKELEDFSGGINHAGEQDSVPKTECVSSVQMFPEGNSQPLTLMLRGSTVSSLEFTPCTPTKESSVYGKESEGQRKTVDSTDNEQKEKGSLSFKSTNEDGQESSQRERYDEGECNKNSPAVTLTLNSLSKFGSWDPEEERRRQERWQQEQERVLQEKYQKEQEKLKEEWEKAQKEVEEEERKYYEEERKIIEDTVVPLTVSPVSSVHHSVSERNGSLGVLAHDSAYQEKKAGKLLAESHACLKSDTETGEHKTQTILCDQDGVHYKAEETQINGTNKLEKEPAVTAMNKESDPENHQRNSNTPTRLNLQLDQQVETLENHLPVNVDLLSSFRSGSTSPVTRGSDGQENMKGAVSPSQCQSPNRSVSGKKLCSTCKHPLGKGAAMIIETLSLYFHIQCFKCGICKGQLGDATTGTDVRIRNGLLNCNDCYVKSRTAGHPTPL